MIHQTKIIIVGLPLLSFVALAYLVSRPPATITSPGVGGGEDCTLDTPQKSSTNPCAPTPPPRMEITAKDIEISLKAQAWDACKQRIPKKEQEKAKISSSSVEKKYDDMKKLCDTFK
jgi:hypothetical protein